VAGLSGDDVDYPLVREVRISLRAAFPEKGKRSKREQQRLAEKIAALEALLRDSPKPLVTEQPEILWIASAGDLMLGRGAQDILLKEGPEGIFGGTAELLAGADITLVNLEGAVSSRGEKVEKAYNFRFDPKVAPALKEAGIDAVLLANNHVFDYGETAFRDSLTHLQNAGIGILGAGLNDTEAARPWTFRKGNTAVQVFGLASYPRERSGWDGLTAAAEADKPGLLHAGKGGGEKLKANFIRGDGEALDIVLFHGGDEWSRRPTAATRKLYTDLVQQGADLVIGSHPHVVQGFEWIEGKPIFWSLGNYVFGGMENTEGGEEGLFIRLGFRGSQMMYLEPYALTLTHTRTDLALPEKLNNFYELSRALATK
jgi:poly-gamma-glutamate synthesis protein (capsule biosynthesis protein)